MGRDAGSGKVYGLTTTGSMYVVEGVMVFVQFMLRLQRYIYIWKHLHDIIGI